jgi:FkbM family methyltransferase
VIEIEGFWWPDDVGAKWQHSLRHVRTVETAIRFARSRRTVVQAGGNIGLWPHRLAQKFERVITFEPEPVSRECLVANLRDLPNVTVRAEALGATRGTCVIARKSLGSHKVAVGAGTEILPLDELKLTDLDFLCLDVEGYEQRVIEGAWRTIERCHPLIQVEMRGFTSNYGGSDDELERRLLEAGYRVLARPSADVLYGFAA